MVFLFNIALIGIFVVLVLLMYKGTPYALMPVASIALVLVWQGVSVAYLETGAYSPELMLATYWTGATLRYVLAIVSFLLAYWAVFRLIVSRSWIKAHQGNALSLTNAERFAAPLIFACLIGILVLLCYAPRGAIDSRSKFLVENPVFLRDLLLGYQPYLTLVLGYATGITSKPRTSLLGYVSLLLMLSVLYLYGNKFSAVVETFFFFFLPFLALLKFRPFDRSLFGWTMRRQVAAACAVLILAVFAGVLRQVQYLRDSGADSAGTQYLAERVFILQGGVWWNTDNQAIHGTYQPGFKEFADFARKENYYADSSLMYLMTRAIGYDLTYKIFMVDHSLFTGTFPSIFYEIGGKFGPVLFGALSGVVIAFAAGYATRKILLGQVLLTIIALGIYIPISNIASAAEFTPLISWGLLTKIGIVVCLELHALMVMLAPAADSTPEA
jgi:hypothetical protein